MARQYSAKFAITFCGSHCCLFLLPHLRILDCAHKAHSPCSAISRPKATIPIISLYRLMCRCLTIRNKVCVIDSSSEQIPITALTGRLFPYYKFLSLTRRNPQASITYTFKGERFELERIADKPELIADPDWFERHYLVFQATDWDKKTTYCDWRW